MISLYKAKILEMMANTDGPVTFVMIRQLIDVSKRGLTDNLHKMEDEKTIEKHLFSKEGLDPRDYLGNRPIKGQLPKYFYTITEAGLRKYEYFKEKGIYDTDLTPQEFWLKEKSKLFSEPDY